MLRKQKTRLKWIDAEEYQMDSVACVWVAMRTQNCVTRFDRRSYFVLFQLLLHDCTALGISGLLFVTAWKSSLLLKKLPAFIFSNSHLSNAILYPPFRIWFTSYLVHRRYSHIKRTLNINISMKSGSIRHTVGVGMPKSTYQRATNCEIGIRFPAGAGFFFLFFPNQSFRTCSGAHPASSPVETGSNADVTWSWWLTSV
jgi:hypothetical protein